MVRSSLLLALLLLPACGNNFDFVRPQRFADAGEPADGRLIVSDAPTLQITVKIASDATDFDPTTILRLMVNGIDRSADMTIGGNYAVLTIDPPPIGTSLLAEVFLRTGTDVLDTATYEAMPYTGPLLYNVTPDTAEAGAQVTVTGFGFSAAPLRVFFGGAEGTVDASTDTTITATVPTDAAPGLLFVLVGADSAVGLVPFLPVDSTGAPLPQPKNTRLFYIAPARGRVETVCTIAGLDYDDGAVPRFNNRNSSRVFNVATVNFPLIGDVVLCYGVVDPYTDPAAEMVQLLDHGGSNELPFTVE